MRISIPYSVCRPRDGTEPRNGPFPRSSKAMIGTEGVSAVISKPSGTEKTASPWLVQAFCSSGVPAKRPSWLFTTRSERPYSRIWTAPTSPPSSQRHELHPVADAQHGHAEIEERTVYSRGALLVDAVWAAGEDDAFGVLRPDLLNRRVVWDHLRVDAAFADAAGDELRVLPAEVQDEDQATRPSRRAGRAARACPPWPATART